MGDVLQKALTAGGVTLILLTVFTEFRRRSVQRLRTEASVQSLPQINRFLEDFAAGRGWDSRMAQRLQAAAEETLLTLCEPREGEPGGVKRLLVSASVQGAIAELEFASAFDSAENLEDRIALLTNPGPGAEELGTDDLERSVERDASLRLLRRYAASVAHWQYHDVEVIAVRVAPPAPE